MGLRFTIYDLGFFEIATSAYGLLAMTDEVLAIPKLRLRLPPGVPAGDIDKDRIDSSATSE